MDLVKCNCKGKCDTKRCGCKKAIPSLVCTDLCNCSDECENIDQDYIGGIEESSDEEEYE